MRAFSFRALRPCDDPTAEERGEGRLTTEERAELRRLSAAGFTVGQLAKRYRIRRSVVRAIVGAVRKRQAGGSGRG